MTDLLTQGAGALKDTTDPFEQLRTRQFWQTLNPLLHVDDAAYIHAVAPIELDDAAHAVIRQRMAKEGYFQYQIPDQQRTLPLDAMAQSVRQLLANGLVSPFAYMYDEFWLLFVQQARILGGFLGDDFRILPDFWVWHVDPTKGESGWRPHRDKGRVALNADGSPKSLTMWVPLTQATPMNGCMYILPASRDPGYNTVNESDLKFDYPDIRALPAEPGQVLCWNQSVLHWDSRTSPFASEARISVALEFQRGDITPFNLPLLNPRQLPSFETRLQLIAKQILQYAHMHALTPDQERFARDVLMRAANLGTKPVAPARPPAAAPAAPPAPVAVPTPVAPIASSKKAAEKAVKVKPGGKEPTPFERQWLVNLYSQKQYAEAEACARTMTRQYPKHGFAWKVLGAVLRQMGYTAESLEPMQKAVQIMPTDYEAFNNLGVTLRALGKYDQAVSCYKRALELKPDYPEPYGNMGAALRDQGKLKEALTAYQRKLKLTPEDGEVQHQVASLTGMNTERAPDKYVESVFDDYADRFDAHLQGVLKYDAPSKLVEMVSRHATPPAEKWRILDLGCGTGLIGVASAHLARQLIGVDLSTKMLAKAKARGIYQQLHHADLLTMMKGEAPASHDVVFSADVFIYIGKLDEIVAETRRLLTPGGIVAFSIESPDAEPGVTPPDYELQNTGRYRQSAAYIQRLASEHGFATLDMAPTVIRTDAHKAINGHLVVWRG